MIRNWNGAALLLIAAAFVLRAATPAGYMPAGAGSGLLFKFCPEGVPAEFLQHVAGDADHDHSGHADGDHRCPVGHMLTSAAAVDDTWQPDIAPATHVLVASFARSARSASGTHYHPRGPPA